MQIKRLKLSGFKSFVEPAELRIEPGLTGVVGPNGCGKSNVLEAIRWVMGESSPKSMRGLPSAKSTACLADQAEVNRLVQMNSDATTEMPNFPGTPTFTINGEMVENAAGWSLLEPKIREALGE